MGFTRTGDGQIPAFVRVSSAGPAPKGFLRSFRQSRPGRLGQREKKPTDKNWPRSFRPAQSGACPGCGHRYPSAWPMFPWTDFLYRQSEGAVLQFLFNRGLPLGGLLLVLKDAQPSCFCPGGWCRCIGRNKRFHALCESEDFILPHHPS